MPNWVDAYIMAPSMTPLDILHFPDVCFEGVQNQRKAFLGLATDTLSTATGLAMGPLQKDISHSETFTFWIRETRN